MFLKGDAVTTREEIDVDIQVGPSFEDTVAFVVPQGTPGIISRVKLDGVVSVDFVIQYSHFTEELTLDVDQNYLEHE